MRCRFCLSLALLLLGVATPLAAVTPHLVKDIDPVPQPESSSPHAFSSVGATSYFFADDGQTGNQLWRTDGTPAGTIRLTDPCPGGCTEGPSFLAQSDHLYFFKVLGASGWEVWRTDGTAAGTLLLISVADHFPTSGTWVASQKLLYFSAQDDDSGVALWRTDGTPAGTFLVTDLRPGITAAEVRALTEFNGKLYFLADDEQGSGLWTSDGTAGGARLVRNLAPIATPPLQIDHPFLGAVGRTLVFTGPSPGHGLQLWRSDGTAKGTAPFTSFTPQSGATLFLGFASLGNRLLFVASSKGPGQQLWATDGTAKGTRQLTSFHLQPSQGLVLFTSFGNRLAFGADDGTHGFELWTTDGTLRGTSLLKDICPGACSGAGGLAVQAGNRLYFTATDGVHGMEPWVSTGTAASTHMIGDLCAGSCGSSPYAFYPVGNNVFFGTNRDGQIWHSDSTNQGTVALAAVGSGEATVLGGSLLFAGLETARGTELWRSDGTPQSTGLLADLNTADSGGSFPMGLTAVGDHAFFFAESNGENGLWESDGTAAGTVERAPLPPSGFRGGLVEAAGKEFFLRVDQGETKLSLWRSDGTVSGTFQIDTTGVGVSGPLVVVGNQVVFPGFDDEHGVELWVTDGSVAGPRLLVDLVPGSQGSFPREFAALQGRIYFIANSSLWRSDGTEAGTVLVKEGIAIQESREPALTVHDGRLWFLAAEGGNGSTLWSSDGTPAGTRAETLLAGPGSVTGGPLIWGTDRLFFSGTATGLGTGLFVWDGTPGGLRFLGNVAVSTDPSAPGAVVANGVLYFRSASGNSQNALWVSDGTVAGTHPVLDAAGHSIPEPHYLQAFAGGVYFTNQDNLYQTDGTAAGTFPLLKLSAPGETAFHELVAAGPRLFFRKWDPATGAELWALEAN